jgi:hypothetical protein
MKSFNRMILFISCALLSLGWAVTAHAKPYRLTGGGGQIQIGGGLPLPIQLTNPAFTGTNFPPLLVPAKTGAFPAIIEGTTAMAIQQKLVIPASALSKSPVQKTLGQFGQNPTLYAVATNLGFVWPNKAATLSTGARTGAKTTTFTTALGNSIRYSNPLASKFGGPAQFAISAGPPSGRMPAVPVTIFGIAVPTGGAGNPACTHTALTPVPFPGPGNPACVAGLGQALPTGIGAFGGPVGTAAPFGVSVTTPGGTSLALVSTVIGTMTVNGPGPLPGVGIGKFGANGDVTFFAFTPGGSKRGFTNMASSRGFPFTTGMLTISAPLAAGAPEIFTITGMDNRTAGGAGTIQLVSGSLSQRTKSGPNANRGWVRLVLAIDPSVPALSPVSLAAMAGLMLLVAGYTMRRRLFA